MNVITPERVTPWNFGRVASNPTIGAKPTTQRESSDKETRGSGWQSGKTDKSRVDARLVSPTHGERA